MEVAKLIVEFLRVLVWPVVAVAVTILFRSQLRGLLQRLRKAELPGGVTIDLREEIAEAKAVSERVVVAAAKPTPTHTIPLTEANARLLQLGLAPSPSGLDMTYYRQLALQDPTLALAGLRIEVDVLARNLARGWKIDVTARESGLRLLRRLLEKGAITNDQFDLVGKILRLCNAAIHGQVVSQAEANEIIDLADILAEQYLAWLSWGFDDRWKPKAEKPKENS